MLLAIQVVSFAWVLVTALAGFMHHPYHINWALISSIPILALQYFWLTKGAKTHGKEAILRHYLLLVGILLAWVTGIGITMGFIPFILHQVVVWAFVPFFAWRTSRILLNYFLSP